MYHTCEEQEFVNSASSEETMYYAEQVATAEEVHHIGSKAEFHSIKVNGHDVRMQNDTGSSVTIISTKIWREIGSPTLSTSPRWIEAYDGHRKCKRIYQQQSCHVALGCTKLESPICNPRSNGHAEQAVQNVKIAMRAWNLSLSVSFHAFLQRVLFTQRNTSSVRGKIPSEVLLGRKMRLPAVINYPIGERVVFRAGPHTESFPARCVVRKGNNTAWLTKEDSDGSERTILASTSQIAPFASPTTAALDLVTAKSTTDGTTTTGVAEQTSTFVSSRGPSLVVESSTTPEVPLRRSARVRKPNPRFNDFICK